MIASVHLADLSVRRALAVLRRAPDPSSTPGLRYSKVALAAPLRSSLLPSPDIRRPALVAFWDDDDALSRFLAEDRAATPFAQGWQVRLEPLRAFGRLRITQALRFLRTSAKAEEGVLAAPGLIWATGLGRPPFVSTCSLWESAHAASTYAYGPGDAAHQNAIKTDRARPFHHESAFIRFRPYGAEGRLDRKNRLPEHALAGV